jgi:putative transposase
MKVMDKLYTQDCTLGTRRYAETLKDYGFQMGRDRVRTLMRKMNICAVYRKPRTTVTDPATYKFPYLLRGYKTERPNEVWSIDMSYIPMRHGFMYLFAIIDVHSRYLVSWGLSNSMESGWVVKLIKSAIEKYGKPRIINSDQGSQFTSEEYVKTIKEFEDIRISMDGKGRAIDNVWIERFFRTLKHEHVYLQPSNDGHDLHRSIKTFVHYYNNQRKHSSLQYRTPASVYYAQATGEQNDETTLNQPDGAKLSYAYANVKVKPSGLQVKKSVEKAIFSPQTLTFAPPYR